MRHRVAGYKLGRDTEHRRAMFRNLAAGLFQHGQITTTLQKAKAVQPFVERLITLARKGDLAARRRAIKLLNDRFLVDTVNGYEDGIDVERDSHGRVVEAPRLIKKLFDEIGPKFTDRNGGYTRIIKLGTHRIGDAGDLVVLQLVGDEEGPQVGGQTSRRRQKADARTAYAAKLRKARNTSESESKAEAEAPAEQAVATEEAPAEADTAPESSEASEEEKQD